MDYKEEFYKNYTQGMGAVNQLFQLYESFPGHERSHKGFREFVLWLASYIENFIVVQSK